MEKQGNHFQKRMGFFLDFMGFLDTHIFHDFKQYFAHLPSSNSHSDHVFNRWLVGSFNQKEYNTQIINGFKMNEMIAFTNATVNSENYFIYKLKWKASFSLV